MLPTVVMLRARPSCTRPWMLWRVWRCEDSVGGSYTLITPTFVWPTLPLSTKQQSVSFHLPYKFYLMVHSKDETARHKSDFRFSKK